MGIEDEVQKHWDSLFDYLCHNEDTNIQECLIEVRLLDGKTIRLSWADRDKWLTNEEKK